MTFLYTLTRNINSVPCQYFGSITGEQLIYSRYDLRKFTLILVLVAWSSVSYGAWETIDAVVTRTAVAYSSDKNFAVGLTCSKGQSNSLRGFVFSSLPPSQSIDYELSTSSPNFYLLITGYGFFNSQISWIDWENLEEFLQLLGSDSTLNMIATPSSTQDWPNQLVATIDVRNTGRAIQNICNQ